MLSVGEVIKAQQSSMKSFLSSISFSDGYQNVEIIWLMDYNKLSFAAALIASNGPKGNELSTDIHTYFRCM